MSFASRNNAHKVSMLFEGQVSIPCDIDNQSVRVDGNGVRFMTLHFGTDVGYVKLDYNADGIPDRFRILWDNNVVADSLFVGDHLTGNPPNANVSVWETGGSGTFVGKTYNNVPEYEWRNGVFVRREGVSHTITVTQEMVAPFGKSAGKGSLIFHKNKPFPTHATLEITSLATNTGYSFKPNCVDPDIV